MPRDALEIFRILSDVQDPEEAADLITLTFLLMGIKLRQSKESIAAYLETVPLLDGVEIEAASYGLVEFLNEEN
jgi:hypothetical protein